MATQQLLPFKVPKSTKKKKKKERKNYKHHGYGGEKILDKEAKPKISSIGVEENCSKSLNPLKIHQKS